MNMGECIKTEEIQIDDIKTQPPEDDFPEFINDLSPFKLGDMYSKTLDTEFECDTCGKAFFDNLLLLIHDMFHDTNNYCFICKQNFTQNFHEHLNSLHTNLICPICKKVFAWRKTLEAHMAFHSLPQAPYYDKYSSGKDILKISISSSQVETQYPELQVCHTPPDICSSQGNVSLMGSNSPQSDSPRSKVVSNDVIKHSLEQEDIVHQPQKMVEFTNQKSKNRKDFCPFCSEKVAHFARHLFRKHKNEEAVKEVLNISANSPKRKKLIGAIRREANFFISVKERVVRPVKNVANEESQSNLLLNRNQYVACQDCLGFFRRTFLSRHRRNCFMRPETQENGKKERHLAESQIFMTCSGPLKGFYDSLELKKEVFRIMRCDEISTAAMRDVLVCSYGERLLLRHKPGQTLTNISNKMRELGRLLVAMNARNLLGILTPNFFNSIIAATKVISGFDLESRTFKARSLALNLRTTLRQVCDIATEMIIERNIFLPCEKPEESLEGIKQLKDLIMLHWHAKLGLVMELRSTPANSSIHQLEKEVEAASSDAATKSEFTPKTRRGRWTVTEKEIMKKFFAEHIINKKAPRRFEVEKFKKEHFNTFNHKHWVTIKDEAALNSADAGSISESETRMMSGSPVQDPLLPSVNKSQYILRSEIKKDKSKIIHRKGTDYCFFCKALVLNFARHIHRNHSTELAVQRIFLLPVGSRERKKRLGILRKRGNYLFNCENPKAVKRSPIGSNVLPCTNCLGFYSARQLWRHAKKCIGPHSTVTRKDAQNFLVKNLKIDSQLRSEVFPKMRPDAISLVAKKDFLICAYATRYIKLHRKKHCANIASRKMRELAKVLIEIRKEEPKIKTLLEALSPKYFDLLVTAVKVLAKYNEEKDLYEVPSCAISVGANLKQCCEIAIAFVANDEKFAEDPVKVKMKADLDAAVDLIRSHWRYVISHLEAYNSNAKECNKVTEFGGELQNVNHTDLIDSYIETNENEVKYNIDDSENLENFEIKYNIENELENDVRQEFLTSDNFQHSEAINAQNNVFQDVDLPAMHKSDHNFQVQLQNGDTEGSCENEGLKIEENCGLSVVINNLLGDSATEYDARKSKTNSNADGRQIWRGNEILLPSRKKRILTPWTTAQKAVVNTFFAKHIKNKQAPKKHECMRVKDQHSQLLKNKDWLKIKVYVQNQYVKQSKKSL